MHNVFRTTLLVATAVALTGCSLPWPGAAAANNSKGDAHQAALRFAQCMRDHGITDFPDPTTSGSGAQFQINGSPGAADLDPSSQAFKDASAACQKYLPSGGANRGGPTAEQKQAALRFSQCMRDHGIADFPDPQFNNGGVGITAHAGQENSDLDPNSPAFQAAQQACASILGGIKNGGPTTSQGGPGGSGPVTSGR